MTSIATVYKSSDPGAPQLTGQAGSMVALLDAVLVDGYGVGAGFKAAAGWTREFSGTNKRVYRNNRLMGSGGYLRVDDAATDPRICWVRAYESMTSVDAGTGPSPTPAQRVDGLLWYKSSVANATTRVWEAIATDQAVYLFVAVYPQAGTYVGVATLPHFAGDLESHVEGEKYAFMVGSNTHSSFLNSTATGFTSPQNSWGSTSSLTTACYLLRPYTQLPGGIVADGAVPSHGAANRTWGGVGAAYPDPVSGALLLERPLIWEAAGIVRGKMPGAYMPLHVRPFADAALVKDVSVLPGVTLYAKVMNIMNSNSLDSYAAQAGQLLFDMTNRW